MVEYIAVAALSYLIGSIPSGVLIGKAMGGIDLRAYGSGNAGAANALRILGPKAFVMIFTADLAKGLVPVVTASYYVGSDEAKVIAALSALAGHNWSVYTGFRGGRGVATAIGGCLTISPAADAAATVTALTFILLFRYVSLGSVMGSIAALIVMVVQAFLGLGPQLFFIYGPLGAFMIIFKHRDNIRRIMRGTEPRVGEPAIPRENRD